MEADAHTTNFAENKEFFLNANSPSNFERTWKNITFVYKELGLLDTPVRFDEVMDFSVLRKLDAKGAFICAYVGTIGMACGLEIVLDAAQILLETGRNDILFLLVGDGAQKSELERKARERGLNNVRFTGQVSREEVPAYLSISGVVLVHLKKTPLFTTVMPSKIFEAAGMKKPIICGVAGKAAALIAKAEAGVNITPGSAEELAAAVVDLADQPDKRESFGEQGYRYIVSRFDREELADRYLEIIVRTMEKPSNV